MRVSFLVSEVLTGLRRNVTMTIAMILTTAVSLGLFGAGLLVVKMTNDTRQIFLDRVEVQIFLTEDVTVNDPSCQQPICAGLLKDLQGTPNVSSVRYLDRDDAYADYKQRFASDPQLLDLVRKEALPASFKVKLSDPERFGLLDDSFKARPGVDQVQNQKELVDRLYSVLNAVRNAAFTVAVVQAIVALLLMANMVQIAAFTRRTEVSIMRLVGATRWYTQLPFLLEAVVAALIGSALAIAGLFTAKEVFLDDVLAEVYQANIIAPISTANVVLVSPFLVIAGVVLSAATGYVTLRLYVRH